MNEEHTEHTFDAYCKKILKNAVSRTHRNRKRKAEKVIPISSLTHQELAQLAYFDTYDYGKRTYTAYGREVVISDEDLHVALDALLPRQRDILLLSCCFDLSDGEIARLTSIPRPTVQRRRNQIIQRMREILEELHEDEI